MAAGASAGAGALASTAAVGSDVATVDAVVLMVGAVDSPGGARTRGAADGVDIIARGAAGAGAIAACVGCSGDRNKYGYQHMNASRCLGGWVYLFL